MSKNKTTLSAGSAETLREKDEQVAFRVSKQLRARIWSFAAKNQIKPSDAIRRLIEKGLESD